MNDSAKDQTNAYLSVDEDMMITRHSLAPHQKTDSLIMSTPQILDSYPRILYHDS